MDWPGVRQVPEGSGEQGKMEKTGCKIICAAPTTLAVKGLVMMMMSTMIWVLLGVHIHVLVICLIHCNWYYFLSAIKTAPSTCFKLVKKTWWPLIGFLAENINCEVLIGWNVLAIGSPESSMNRNWRKDTFCYYSVCWKQFFSCNTPIWLHLLEMRWIFSLGCLQNRNRWLDLHTCNHALKMWWIFILGCLTKSQQMIVSSPM